MGLGNIGWFQILVVLVIVLLVFGTKRIRHLGSDLGGAIREFRKGVSDDSDSESGNDSADKTGEKSTWETKSDGDSSPPGPSPK